jgi:UDP-N-acetylmuramoyl-tripeptide--D-alanyl-D-alanine ligase
LSDPNPTLLLNDLYQLFLKYPAVCTDTRKIKEGDLFFALKGDHFNGNEYAVQALENGAAYSIVDQEISDQRYTGRIIRVRDVLGCLQDLAGHHRDQFNIPFIAITGSNGKTTTKELIHAVLSEKYVTYTTEGNLNNHIGIPLTILKIKNNAEMAIVEMGANHLREIAGYCVYTKPTHGLITNSGKAHLEGFGSIEGVRKGKGELYDYLRVHNGTAFVMWDYDYLREMSHGIPKIVTYGTSQADITGLEEMVMPHLRVQITSGLNVDSIQTHLTGNYNLPNVLAAVTIGNYFHIQAEAIKKGIENYVPSNSRSQLIRAGTNTIIMDAYNANPSSMKVAIDNFSHFPGADKILLLGAMAELGSSGPAEHEQIIRQIGESDWKEVVLVGGDFLNIKHPYLKFSTAEEAGKWMSSRSFQNTAFLVKGSRSMRMEKAVESLK